MSRDVAICKAPTTTQPTNLLQMLSMCIYLSAADFMWFKGGGDMSVCYRINECVMGVMKMGNIVPRAGFKPTSLAFRASVLTLHHVGSLTSLLYWYPPVDAAPCLIGPCRLVQMYTFIVDRPNLVVCRLPRLKLGDSNPNWLKQMLIKLIHVATLHGVWH